SNDLSDALDEVLSGTNVSRPTTEVAGCFIARVPRSTNVNAAVTFAKDVAPILQKNCQECHRPGRIGPMPLLTYDDVAPWAETIHHYQYFMVPTGFDEDRYVQAAEIHPGNRELVHHVIVFIRQPGQRGEDRVDGVGGGMLCAYAPGDQPSIFPPGTARKIPKG